MSEIEIDLAGELSQYIPFHEVRWNMKIMGKTGTHLPVLPLVELTRPIPLWPDLFVGLSVCFSVCSQAILSDFHTQPSRQISANFSLSIEHWGSGSASIQAESA